MWYTGRVRTPGLDLLWFLTLACPAGVCPLCRDLQRHGRGYGRAARRLSFAARGWTLQAERQASVLETSFKWMLRGQVERLGRLHELSLGGMDIKDIDAVLNDNWNDRLQLAFTDEWGARHHCAVPGGCALARLTLAGCCLPCGYLGAVVRSCGRAS